MYEAHFGFSELPFSLTPDTQFFLNQHSHRDALNTLLVSLQHSEGFIKVVGEVGTGKTLLSRILLSRLAHGSASHNYVTAYIPNPFLSPEELKYCVAQEIGAQTDKTMAAHELMSSIYRRLLQHARNKKQVVLIIDEAQAMPRDTVEALRLLTNLETEKRKLLQVVLFGQPELDSLLARPDLRQLKQRIVFAEYLLPFTRRQTEHYLKHRLAAVSTKPPIFSSRAVFVLHHAAGGIPRLINIIAHKSLIAAYGRGHQCISAWHVARAVCDTPESRPISSGCCNILRAELFAPRRRHWA